MQPTLMPAKDTEKARFTTAHNFRLPPETGRNAPDFTRLLSR